MCVCVCVCVCVCLPLLTSPFFPSSAVPPPSPAQLYRDCLRLVSHIAPGSSPKSLSLRTLVRSSFLKNKDLTDADAITDAKGQAVRALANYMVYESALRDGSGRLKNAVKAFTEKERPKNDTHTTAKKATT